MRARTAISPLPLLLCLALGLPTTATAQQHQTGPLSFSEVPGEREFSGRMIARPVQPAAWAERGLDAFAAQSRIDAARLAMDAYVVREHVAETDEYVFHVPAGSHENLVAANLMASGNFQYVEPDWFLFPIGAPNDPRFGDQ